MLGSKALTTLQHSRHLPPNGGALTIGFKAAPGGAPGRLGPDNGCNGADVDDGPGVTFPPVGVPDLETGGVDFPLSRGGLLEPGVEA